MIINIWLHIFALSFTILCILLLIFITIIILWIYYLLPIKKYIYKAVFNYSKKINASMYRNLKLFKFWILRKWTPIQTWGLKQFKNLLLVFISSYKHSLKFINKTIEIIILRSSQNIRFLSKKINQITIISKLVKRLTWPKFVNWCKRCIPKMGGAAVNLTYTDKVHNTMLREIWLIIFILIFIYIYHYWFNDLP